jgi:hypothetical protein
MFSPLRIRHYSLLMHPFCPVKSLFPSTFLFLHFLLHFPLLYFIIFFPYMTLEKIPRVGVHYM